MKRFKTIYQYIDALRVVSLTPIFTQLPMIESRYELPGLESARRSKRDERMSFRQYTCSSWAINYDDSGRTAREFCFLLLIQASCTSHKYVSSRS